VIGRLGAPVLALCGVLVACSASQARDVSAALDGAKQACQVYQTAPRLLPSPEADRVCPVLLAVDFDPAKLPGDDDKRQVPAAAPDAGAAGSAGSAGG
jgi:hypothetical protein